MSLRPVLVVGETPNQNFELPSHDTEHLDKRSVDYIVKVGLAGGIAGSSAKTLVAPLDRIKILFQTGKPAYRQFSGSLFGLVRAGQNIYAADGAMGFFQGHSATLLRVFPYAAIKFVAYEQVRRVLIPTADHETALRRLLSGSIAGLCSVFVTYPLDLVRVRLAYETGHSKARGRLLRVLRDVHAEHPIIGAHFRAINALKRVLPSKVAQISNFYRGFIPTIMGMVPYAGVSFLTHDVIHDVLRAAPLKEYTVDWSRKPAGAPSGRRRTPLNTWAQLLAGGLAGMVSQTASYPFEVVRRRMQVGGVNNGEFLSMKDVAAIIWKERGFKGFYVGLSIGFVKIVPMVACSFYVYERCKFNFGV